MYVYCLFICLKVNNLNGYNKYMYILIEHIRILAIAKEILFQNPCSLK